MVTEFWNFCEIEKSFIHFDNNYYKAFKTWIKIRLKKNLKSVKLKCKYSKQYRTDKSDW